MDVSVLFATHNRPSVLEKTLEHLCKLNTDGLNWELIVADNCNRDRTADILESAKSKLPLRVVKNDELGKSAALNAALPLAQGELLVFTDDDVVPSDNWLRELDAAAKRHPTFDVFGGPTNPMFEEAPPAWLDASFFAVAAFAPFHPDAGETSLPWMIYPWGPNYAVRRSAMSGLRFSTAVGPRGSDYAMGSETHLLLRLRARGCQFLHVPSAPVRHRVGRHQMSEPWLLRRAYRAGRGGMRFVFESRFGRCEHSSSSLRLGAWLAWLRYRLCFARTQENRITCGWRYQQLRGAAAEARVFARFWGDLRKEHTRPSSSVEYLDQYLPALLEHARDFAFGGLFVFGLHLSDVPNGDWYIDLRSHRPACRRGKRSDCDFSVEISSKDFENALARSDIDTALAGLYYHGRVRLSGKTTDLVFYEQFTTLTRLLKA